MGTYFNQLEAYVLLDHQDMKAVIVLETRE